MKFFGSDRSKAALLAAMALLVYLPFISNPLIFDDLPFFPGVLGFADFPFNLYQRWFPYVSLGVTAAFAENHLSYFRIENLLLHNLNVLLLLLLLRLWISLFITDVNQAKLARWGAWLGALVFACHPLAVYAVGYLVERSILMATLFSLVMYLAYLRGLLENNGRYLALAVAAYFLAVFSKEHSVMAPALLLPLTWLLRERIRVPAWWLLATWLGFFCTAVLIVLRMKGLLGVAYEADAASLFAQQNMVHASYLLSVLTQAGLFFKYCLLMLLPNPAWMSIDMRENFITSAADWTNWIGLAAFVLYGLIALRLLFCRGRLVLLGLALLYPWLLFMTEFSTIRVQESFVLYRSYLWLPGYMLLFALLASWLPERRVWLAGVVLAAVLVPLAWNRLWVFADEYRLWDDAVKLLHGEDRLGAQRTYYNRALASEKKKNWDAAIADYRKSLAIDDSHPQVYLALANAYYGAGRYQEALTALDTSITRDGKNAYAYFNRAMVRVKLEGKPAALPDLKRSCELGYVVACGIVEMEQRKLHLDGAEVAPARAAPEAVAPVGAASAAKAH